MAISLALAAIDPSYRDARIPVMEHYIGLSRTAVQYFTGDDPLAPGAALTDIYRRLAIALDIDLFWGEGPVVSDRETHDWSNGETVKGTREGHPSVQWGVFHVVSQEDGRHFLNVPKPASVAEALEFDPLQYFPDTVAQYRAHFQREHEVLQQRAGAAGYVIPQHYTTVFHWALAIFGFELLCEAGMEEADFHALIGRFAAISRRITTAWAQVHGLKAFICHDDLTMTRGPVFAPDWYRRHIFPLYPGIFAPLKAAGVPVIFTSDGNCTCFVDDIFSAGADGLNFEYLVDLAPLVEQHGDKILIGNLCSEVIAGGPVARIESEVRRIVDIGRHAPRFVFNVGGGLTHDMPVLHLQAYLDIRKRLCRGAVRPWI